MTRRREERAIRYVARLIVGTMYVAGIWLVGALVFGPDHVPWILAAMVIVLLAQRKNSTGQRAQQNGDRRQ